MPEKEQIFRAIEDASMAARPVMQHLLSAHKVAAGRRFWKTAEKIEEAVYRLCEDERDTMVSAITELLTSKSASK